MVGGRLPSNSEDGRTSISLRMELFGGMQKRRMGLRWFGPYVVKKVEENATYHLVELDGTPLALPIAGKRIKIFKRRETRNLEIEA